MPMEPFGSVVVAARISLRSWYGGRMSETATEILPLGKACVWVGALYVVPAAEIPTAVPVDSDTKLAVGAAVSEPDVAFA